MVSIHNDSRKCECGNILDPLQLCDCPAAMADWVSTRTNLTHVAQSLRKASDKQRQLESQLAAEREARLRAESDRDIAETACRVEKERAEAAEARIKASQEQEPVACVRYGLFGIPEFYTAPYPYTSDFSLYKQPIIPPEVEELQREIEMLRTGDTCARHCEGQQYSAMSALAVLRENAELTRKLAATSEERERMVELVAKAAASGSTLEQAKQISIEHCRAIEQLQENFAKCGHYAPVMEAMYQMFKERLIDEEAQTTAAPQPERKD